MTYSLSPMSVAACYQEVNNMLTMASIFLVKEGEVPNMDSDLSVDLFLPLEAICTSFDLIVPYFFLSRDACSSATRTSFRSSTTT